MGIVATGLWHAFDCVYRLRRLQRAPPWSCVGPHDGTRDGPFLPNGHHIMFPLGIVIYKRRNPLAVLPEAGRVANEMAEPTLPVESPEKTKQRIQQIVDTNFHKIQVAFNERKRLPTLTDPKRPVGKGQKKPRVAPAAIVVRPRSTK